MIASNSPSLAEVFSSVKCLPRADKFRLMQLLAVDIAEEEGVSLLVADQPVAIWSQFDAAEGAAALERFLNGREL